MPEIAYVNGQFMPLEEAKRYFSRGPQTELTDDEAPAEPATELSALSPLGGRFGVQLTF